MTNTPIHRIPLEGMTEGQMINAEVDAGGLILGIKDELIALAMHTSDQDALSITLDWAMQLREKTGQDWGTCISIASTGYFG